MEIKSGSNRFNQIRILGALVVSVIFLLVSGCGGGGGSSCKSLPDTQTVKTILPGLNILDSGNPNANDFIEIDTRTLTISLNAGSSIVDAGNAACFGSVSWPGGGQTDTITAIVGHTYIVQFADGTFMLFQITSDINYNLVIMVADATQI
jgi:hypothetical protein